MIMTDKADMNCDELKKISGGYLDDAIPEHQKEEVEEHLSQCPVCSFLMNQMRLLRGKLNASLCKDCCPGNLREKFECLIKNIHREK